MFRRNHTRLSALLTVAVLLCAALPAGAQGTAAPSGTGLRLEQAWAAGNLRLGLEAAAEASATEPPPVLSERSQASAAETWKALREEHRIEGKAAPRMQRFGKWLKKHWYVPVLAAVAIGVAVSDDGSDGPEDEED